MQNSDEYLFSIKMTNFKIILSNLIESIEYLEDENDLDKSVQIGKELIIQFGLITEKFSIYNDKLDKHENNIKNLNSVIEKNEILIDEYQLKYNIEHENLKNLQISLNESIATLEKNENDINELESVYNKNIHELQTTCKELCENIKEMQKIIDRKTVEIIDLKDVLKEERNKKEKEIQSQKSIAYIEKLNEGNLKVIQKHCDKIKELDNELIEYKRKIVDFEKKNKEIDKEIDKEIEIEKYDNFKTENIALKDDNYKLQKEIEQLRYYKDLNYNDINNPLLSNESNKHNKQDDLCNFCCIS